MVVHQTGSKTKDRGPTLNQMKWSDTETGVKPQTTTIAYYSMLIAYFSKLPTLQLESIVIEQASRLAQALKDTLVNLVRKKIAEHLLKFITQFCANCAISQS